MPRVVVPGVIAAVVAALLTTSPAAADWPQWRGPESNAVAPAGDFPTDLSPAAATWRVDLPGPGASTPIVAGDRIFVTCEIDGDDALLAFDVAGNELWRRQFGQGRAGKHRNATGANPSPATDGELVYAYFKSGRLACIDRAGEPLWERNLQTDFGEDTLWWDLGSSPILTPHGVVVAVMQAGDSYVACFDAASGEVLWKQPRSFARPEESDQSYATPILTNADGQPTLVVWGADYVTGHDPATGEERFRCGGFNPEDKPMWRSIASATVAGEKLLVPFGRSDFVGAMRLGGSGDVTATHRLWTTQGVGSDVCCIVVRDGMAYVLGDRGAVTCLRADDGAIVWTDALPRSKAKYFSSPLLAGDLLYAFREDGAGFTVRIGDTGAEVVAEQAFEDTLVASPVPLGDSRLLVRTRGTLYCFGG